MKHVGWMVVGAGLSVLSAVVAACGSSNGGGASSDAAAACVPGAQTACACPGGGEGAQVCEAGGTYGACVGCPVEGDATAPPSDDAGDADREASTSDAGSPTAPDSGTSLPEAGPTSDAAPAEDAAPARDAAPAEDAAPAKDAAACDPAAWDFTGACGGDAGPCDQGLPANGSASDFARAIGICATSVDATHWGLVSASYSANHTTGAAGLLNFDAQHGILPAFGSAVVPREGASLGVLSTGSATATDSDDGPLFRGDKGGMQGTTAAASGAVPTGFPKAVAGCPVASSVFDVIDLKLQIRVPTNAGGFAIDFDFLTGGWPDYVCSPFDDEFVAFLTSSAFNGGAAGNISFDSDGDAISVDAHLANAACTPSAITGCNGLQTGAAICAAGPASLAGTGFGDDGDGGVSYCPGSAPSTSGSATTWLTTSAPVTPGEVMTLELIIADTGDQSYDSSVLLDHFHWLPQPVAVPVTITAPPN